MDSKTKRLIERYENDFDRLSANEMYTPEQLVQMKDLQKLMYYIELRCEMKKAQEEEQGQSDDEKRSYARRRNAMGQFTSGHYPMMEDEGRYYENMGSGRRYYEGNGGYGGNNSSGEGNMSGRRYYDSEKEKAIHYLHKALDSETRPDVISDIQAVIRELEMK